jgi:hypothetical protein
MAMRKRFQVVSWETPTSKSKENDGEEYFIDEFDSLLEAEEGKQEWLRFGWSRTEIRELKQACPSSNSNVVLLGARAELNAITG